MSWTKIRIGSRATLPPSKILKDRGMKGSGIIGAYHTRRVAPLMSRALPLYLMAPGASLEGMTLADGVLPPIEVARRIKEAMEPSKDNNDVVLNFVYLVPGHPPMRPEPGFIDFVSSPFPCLFLYLNFQPFDPDLRIAGPAKESCPHG